MSFNHVPLIPKSKLTQLEERRKIPCWHLLTIILSLFSSSVASYLFVRGWMFYTDIDHTWEECTINWNSNLPCHYLRLWMQHHGDHPGRVYYQFINAFSVFLIVITAQIQVIGKNPWFFILFSTLIPLDFWIFTHHWHRPPQSLANHALACHWLDRYFDFVRLDPCGFCC